MAKQSGLGWTTLSVDDAAGSAQVIKNDITNFQFATPRGVYDWTGVDKSAYERGLGLADFSITLNGVFNPAANMSHAVLKTIPSTTVLRAITLTVAAQTLVNECLGTDYNLTRAADGNLTWTAPFVLADGTVPTWS
jgi:hypothetical protein